MASIEGVVAWFCRASYYISLLGLKIPMGLLLRASHARYVLACILFVWVPFLAYTHVVLLPKVPTLQQQPAVLLWHALTAMWMTIPLCVVGSVILSRVQGHTPTIAFFGAFATMIAFHALVIPAIATTQAGVVFLQAAFAFFEDLPIVGWVWCLYHVVSLQIHVAKCQAAKQTPITVAHDDQDRVIIIGNAPTVVEGEPLGHLIDDFSHVVRFNTYTVAKPDYTGVRVGYHFCNGRNFPTNNSVKAILPLFNASLTHAAYLFMPHMEEARIMYATLTSPKADAWFVEEEQILALRKELGVRIWQIPTSGAVAIDAFLSKRQQVTLHGFNFFQSKKIHYFEESPTQLVTSWLERFVTHDPGLEKVWVERMKAESRVILLSKDSTRASVDEGEVAESSVAGKTDEEDAAKLRRRAPSLVQTLLRDGMPSQFSL